MCGIVGVLNSRGPAPTETLLRSMADCIVHRGPDGDGYMVDGQVGLAHRRLAIIDVAGSPQPMTSVDGHHTIVFNGEILNYKEVRQRFDLPSRTSGDTEVVLEMVARHGIDSLRHLRGQFAFAILDRRTGSLTIARDRLGILPLFWTRTADGFACASEVKSLQPVAEHWELDRASLADYLMYRAVPAPHTLFEGIKKLEPGRWMRIDANGAMTEQTYWSLTDVRPAVAMSPDEAVDLLEQHLKDAIDDALVADVPIGAYLSGGVDSTVTVALAARATTGGRLKTFAAGFDNSDMDERSYARRVSNIIGTDHHEVVVDEHSFVNDLWRLTWFRDLPVSQVSDPAVAALARAASDHVKVVISGEGSDELFGGYPKYRFAKATALAGYVPGVVRSPVANLARRTLATQNDKLDTALRAMSGRTEWNRLMLWFSSYTAAEVKRLTGHAGRTQAPLLELHGDPVARMGVVDMWSWLGDNLLERGDRMTMASSIELRPPFLDARVVEFALGMPSDIKLHNGVGKWPVKQLAKRYVDPDIIDRPKVGFQVPLGDWFRGRLADTLRDVVLSSDSIAVNWLDRTRVTTMIDEHTSAKADHAKQLWPIFALEVWARTVLNGDRSSAPSIS